MSQSNIEKTEMQKKPEKCWIHLGNEHNLRIKNSEIPNAGLGLFSYKKPFEKRKR